MPRAVIIINPVSGPKRRGTRAARVDAATRALESFGVGGDVRLTERAGHAYELALEAAVSGAEIVIAWGGDGTINEVGRALVQRDDEGADAPALGIIPGGSGNGLARELGIPFDPRQAIARALRSKPRRVDAGELGDRLFFNVAGIGLDAHVAALVATRVHHRGLLPYLTAIAGDVIRYQPVDYSIEIERQKVQVSALVLALANSRQWGFGARIAPHADLEDGALDFVMVQSRGLLGDILRIPSLFLRQIDRQPGVDTRRVRELTIRSREAMLFHVDGEVVQGSDTLVARVHPRALQLRV